jgi:nicotinamidase-related amidase
MLLDTPVLLCLDLQMEFIAPGRPFADPDGDLIAARCSELIQDAREAGWSVVHTQLHRGGPLIAGQGLTQPIPGCEPRPGEVLLRRAGVSAFAHPDLEGVLQGAAESGAYVIGFSAPLSLTSTLFDAEDRGQTLRLSTAPWAGRMSANGARRNPARLLVHTAERLNRSITLEALQDRLRTPAVAAPALAAI